MKTEIQNINRTKLIDYSTKQHENFWSTKNKDIGDTNDYRSFIKKELENSEKVIVCIQTSELDDQDIINELFNLAQYNTRIYILLDKYSNLLDPLSKICLIRYGVKTVGSYVLINPNTNINKGVFFSGKLNVEDLEENQHLITKISQEDPIKNLYHHFCYQFWEKAGNEVIEGNHSVIKGKPIEIYHDENKFGGKNFIYGTLFNYLESVNRKDLLDNKIIYTSKESNKPIHIIPNSTKDLPNVTFNELKSKDELENMEPQFCDDEYSLNIKYNWQNLPFYLPENAVKHHLYKEWEEKKQIINKELQKIIEKIKEFYKFESEIHNNVKKAFLGKQIKLDSLERELEELKLIEFDNLKSLILEQKIGRINEINSIIDESLTEIKRLNKNEWIREEIDNLNSIKIESIQQLELKKKDYEEKINNEDLKPFLPKIKDEIKKLEIQIENIDKQIKIKTKEKQIEQKDCNTTSSLDIIYGNEIQNSNYSTHLKEALKHFTLNQIPQIGSLFKLKDTNYLAIKYWEEYDSALEEAKRLDAILCAIKN